jgi:hypothetical protein
MELNIPERLNVLSLLPKEGTYANIKEVRKAREIIALNSDDLKAIDFVPAEDKYDPVKADNYYRDIPISEWVTNTIQGILVKKSTDGKLAIELMSVYEKFVLDHE